MPIKTCQILWQKYCGIQTPLTVVKNSTITSIVTACLCEFSFHFQHVFVFCFFTGITGYFFCCCECNHCENKRVHVDTKAVLKELLKAVWVHTDVSLHQPELTKKLHTAERLLTEKKHLKKTAGDAPCLTLFAVFVVLQEGREKPKRVRR